MRIRIAVVGVFLWFSAAAAFGQATASLNGRIVDQGGAVLPGVTVTATNTATGARRDTVTNGEGLYTVPALPAATYTIKADLTGFAPQTRSSVQLLTGTTLTVDFEMSLAGVQENLTVTPLRPSLKPRNRWSPRPFARPKWRSCRC